MQTSSQLSVCAMLEKEKGCGEYEEGSGEQGRVGDRAAQRKLALTDSKCN